MRSKQNQSDIRIIPFEDGLATEFSGLNRAWLEHFNLMEPADEEYINSPRELIIEAGGQILFAIDKENVVGTCAVIPQGGEVVELAKLAVTPAAQGRGIGR